MPQLEMSYALIGCLATCTVYALLLSTKRGVWLTLHLTWLTVVIGVALILAFIATQGEHGVWTDVLFFAAGGFPVVVRSLWLAAAHLWAYILYRATAQGDK